VKNTYALFSVVIVVSAIILVSNTQLSKADTETTFNGVIETDTIWTEAHSPYTITGNVLVNNGTTLTIQPGVTVNLGSYYIKVNGTLQAVGNSTNKVTFNDGEIIFTQYSTRYDNLTAQGCLIEKGTISSKITIEGGSPMIANSTITSGVSIDSGAPTISGNKIRIIGISIHSQNVTIQGNIISDCERAIQYTTSGKSPCLIEGNLIINNTNGIVFNSFLASSSDIPIIIQNNTITGNGIGISCSSSFTESYPNIIYNNIFGNTNYNLETLMTKKGNATFNWWGTTDNQAINQTIYDRYDNFEYGIIDFSPFLTSPNTAAPTFTNASASSGGSISPNGITKLNYADNQTFTITASGNYHLSKVVVNGTSIGAVSSYTVEKVSRPNTHPNGYQLIFKFIVVIFAFNFTPNCHTYRARITHKPTANNIQHNASLRSYNKTEAG
jgi:hypothetical protein